VPRADFFLRRDEASLLRTARLAPPLLFYLIG